MDSTDQGNSNENNDRQDGFSEEVNIHILDKARRRIVNTDPWKSNDGLGADRDYIELRVNVEAQASFKLTLNEFKLDMNESEQDVILGQFPHQIYDMLVKLKASKLMLRSSTSDEVNNEVPAGTELFVQVPAHSSNGIDEDFMKRIVGGGFTCTPLLDMQNNYGRDDMNGYYEYHGILPVVSGMCSEEVKAHRDMIPSNDGVYLEVVSTLLSTAKGALSRTSNRSLGLSATASPTCFSEVNKSDYSKQCEIRLNLVASYDILVDAPGNEKDDLVRLSLDQFFLGSNRARQGINGKVLVTPFRSSNTELRADYFSENSMILTKISLRRNDCSTINKCREHDYEELFKKINFPKFVPSQTKSSEMDLEFFHLVNHMNAIDVADEWISFPLGMINDTVDNKMLESQIHSISRSMILKKGVVNSGTFQTIARNGNRNCGVTIDLYGVYPSFVSPLLYTHRIHLHQGGQAGIVGVEVPSERVIVKTIQAYNENGITFDFRSDGSILLHVVMSIPPDSSLWIDMNFDPYFAESSFYPADPNRGLDVPPTFAAFTKEKHCFEESLPSKYNKGLRSTSTFPPFDSDLVIYTKSLLLMPPLPDSTMTYNVLSLNCTLFTFVIGMFMNFMVRKTNDRLKRKMTGEAPEKSKMKKLLLSLQEKIKSFRAIFLEPKKLKSD